jgi:hypothetical protein
MSKHHHRGMDDAMPPRSAQLLLYVSGELPDGQRQAIDRQLQADPALRRELERLRAVESSIRTTLSEADAGEPIDVRLRGIDREMSRLLRQWNVDRVTARPTVDDVHRTPFRRVPLWLYPLAAAAAVALLLGVWSLVLREPTAVPIAGIDTPEQPDDNDPTANPGPDLVADRGFDFANLTTDGDEPDEFTEHLAAVEWNPLGDVGGDSLATLERDYHSLQLMEYSQYGSPVTSSGGSR